MEYLIHNYCPVFKWWTFFTFIINCQKQEGVILLFFSFFHLSFYLLFYPCKFDDSTAKGRISKQEIKSRQIFRKTNISYRLMRSRTYAYQGVRNVRFSENLTCCFLVTSVLRFARLPYYRQSDENLSLHSKKITLSTFLAFSGRNI